MNESIRRSHSSVRPTARRDEDQLDSIRTARHRRALRSSYTLLEPKDASPGVDLKRITWAGGGSSTGLRENAARRCQSAQATRSRFRRRDVDAAGRLSQLLLSRRVESCVGDV